MSERVSRSRADTHAPSSIVDIDSGSWCVALLNASSEYVAIQGTDLIFVKARQVKSAWQPSK